MRWFWIDRFIEFEVPPPPDPQWQATLTLVGEVIEDFFSGAGTIVWDGDASRWLKFAWGLKAMALNQFSNKSTYDANAVIAASPFFSLFHPARTAP
mgnify:CR=1 FL=1